MNPQVAGPRRNAPGPLADFDATIGERYVAFNRWLTDPLADLPALNPSAMPRICG